MSIFETIGMSWVIFTSSLATVGLIYLAYVGLKTSFAKEAKENENVPMEVKEMFKIAR